MNENAGAELNKKIEHFRSGWDAASDGIERLSTELKKIKQQEPVGHLAMDGYFIQNPRYVMENGKVPRAMPLYLAPGAQPVPAVYTRLSKEHKNRMWCDATIELASHERCYLRGIEDAERAMLEAAKDKP